MDRIRIQGPCRLHGKVRVSGAKNSIEHGYVVASCPRLKGAEIVFDDRTVTGTENLMMAAALADGRTVLKGCALEPEVVDLARFLNACGARIEGAGTGRIVIEGVARPHGPQHTVIPDRIEAGTFLMAASATRRGTTIPRRDAAHLESVPRKQQER